MITYRGTLSEVSMTPGHRPAGGNALIGEVDERRHVVRDHGPLLVGSPVKDLQVVDPTQTDLLYGHDVERRLAPLQSASVLWSKFSSARNLIVMRSAGREAWRAAPQAETVSRLRPAVHHAAGHDRRGMH